MIKNKCSHKIILSENVMFDSTFFKFLIAFVLIIAVSFLIMGIASGFNTKYSANTNTFNSVVR